MNLPPGLLPGGRFGEWQRNQIDYCVADIDGTLVASDNRPSAGARAAVSRLQTRGIQVGVATGRMRLSAEPIALAIGADGPHVLHNGAEVRRDGHRLEAWPLSVEHLDAILEIGRSLGAYAEIYVDDGYLVTHEDARALPHWELLGTKPLGTIRSIDDAPDVPLKATFAVFDDLGLAGAVRRAVIAAGLRAGSSHSPVTPGIVYVNTTHPDVDKGVALEAAARHARTTLAATAAIGDAGNDIPLLLAAGTAVAMGQADDEVRAAAHLVAPPVDDDGVTTALAALVAP